MAGGGITRDNTVEVFLKGRTELRISPESVPEFVKGIDQVAEAAAAKAFALTKADRRTTLLDRDVAAAFQDFGGGPVAGDPAGLFAQLDRLEPDEIAQVIRMVDDWLKKKQP